MQFGRALDHILHSILTADPRHGPVYLMKHDVADGFYRLFLQPHACLSLAMVVPVAEGEPSLVAIPLALPMGWAESPPYFCATTETVVDLVNQAVGDRWHPPKHRLEELAASPGERATDRRQTLSRTGRAGLGQPESRRGH